MITLIYGVQIQDELEPWGWETIIHTADADEARRVYEVALDRVRASSGVALELDSVRLVEIKVYPALTDEQREKVLAITDARFGVTVIERGGRSDDGTG